MRELIVDNFAGGGGASLGIEMALSRHVDIAINHDSAAIAMHLFNHPNTHHLCENIWKVDPLVATGGRPVGLAWFSPDCTHHSRARGGKPVKKDIRGLAWVAVRWAQRVRPRVMIIENVAEFRQWGPLLADDKADPDRKGETYDQWVGKLQRLGYEVQWRELVAADYGAPTIRKRLFIVARCDGQPIVWPESTHGPGREKPYRTAAECIDWSLPCPSIFERKKPLAENTMKRIARGIQKFVIEAQEPFIVTCNHGGDGFRGQGLNEPMKTITAARDAHGLVMPYIAKIGQTGSNGGRIHDVGEPLRTIVSKAEDCLVMPHLTKYHGLKGNETRGGRCDDPISTLDTSNRFGLVMPHLMVNTTGNPPTGCDVPVKTLTTGNHQYLCAALMAQHNGGAIGRAANAPLSTLTSRCTQQQIVTSHMIKLRGTCRHGQPVTEPMPTLTAGGLHVGEVRAFLIKYYGTGGGQTCAEPMHTITGKAHLGLVVINGVDYCIVDIGMRMLQPRELARAQGFPDSYLLTGSKTNQTARIGNSVSPQPAAALVKANVTLDEYGVGVA